MARVFISHSSRDAAPAVRIKEWLAAQGFATPFLDFDKHAGIAPGANWEKTLYEEIERSEAVVIIQTSNWLDSKWCFAEFTQARALGKPIFPIIEPPTGDTLVSPDIQALDLRRDREGGLEQLAQQLTQLALNAQGGFPWDAQGSPYPGLLAFGEDDAAIYFGRDDDIRRLIERLNARRTQGGAKLIALLGASGSGKSSLLRAGVIPRLKRSRRNWIVLPPVRPQTRPVDELAKSLTIACGGNTDWRLLREQLSQDDFARCIKDLASDLRIRAAAPEAQILLPIDQGEELFSTALPEQSKRFFEILDVALSEDCPFLSVMALRSDFLGMLQSAPLSTARFEQHSLGPMPLSRIGQIIQGPARVAGLGLDERIVQRAIHDAQTEDALPLLAFALRRLFDTAGDDNYLSLEEYEALGNQREGLTPLENSVRKAADEVLANASPDAEELSALRDAFVASLVRVNEQREYVRRPARWDELPKKAQPLLLRLVEARLLVVTQVGDDRIVDVAHEALLRKWPRVRVWLDDAREFLAGKQQLEADVLDWEHAAEADKLGALLTGPKLNRARGWLAERPRQLTEQERAFIQVSIDRAEAAEREKEERRRREIKRNRWITFGAVTAGLAMTGLAAFSAIKASQAEARQILALTGESEARLASNQAFDDLTALRSAVEAGRDLDRVLLPEPELAGRVRSTLQKVLYGVREQDRVKLGKGKVVTGLDPKGRSLGNLKRFGFECHWDNLACIWDKSGELRTKLLAPRHYLDLDEVTFSPDLSKAVVVSAKPDSGGGISSDSPLQLRLWDLGSITPMAEWNGHREDVCSVSFSPDGGKIAIAGGSGIRLWDGAGKPLVGPQLEHGRVTQVSFSPDGNRLAGVVSTRFFNFDTHQDEGKVAVRIWSVAGDRTVDLLGDVFSVGEAHFASKGDVLVTSGEGNLGLWDLSGKQLSSFKGPTRGAVLDAEGYVAGVGDHGIPQVWSADGKLLFELRGHQGDASQTLLSPDGKRLVSAGTDETLRLWSLEDKTSWRLESHGVIGFGGFAISPDGTKLATGEEDGVARIWDRSGKLLRELPSKHEDWRTMPVGFSPDGHQLAVTAQDGVSRLWDVESGTLVKQEPGKELVGDGSFLLTDGEGNLWTWQGEQLARSGQLKGRVVAVNRGAKGVRIVTAESQNSSPDDAAVVHVWDGSGGQLAQFQATGYSLRFSPDGALLATTDSGSVTLRDVTGKQVATFRVNSWGVVNVAFSADGSLLVAAGLDGIVKVYELATQRELAVYDSGAKGQVKDVAFTSDGQVAVVANDGVARFWQIQSLDSLMARGCDWLRDYLAHNPDVTERERHLCDGIGPLATQ